MKQGTDRVPLRRDQALAFIIETIARSGISPSLDELARALAISQTRAKQLVAELIARGSIERTPGTQRGLRVIDVAGSRMMFVEALKRLGWSASGPMGEPFSSSTLASIPRLPPLEYLPDE